MKKTTIVRIILWLFLFSFMLVVVSCTPQQRLNKLKKKHPYLFQTDTLIVRDTVRTETVKKDTSFLFTNSHDTVTIIKDQLIVKVVKLPGDSIWIEGTCKGDTIYLERKIPCDRAIIVELPFYQKLSFWLIVLLVVAVLILIKNFKKII